MRVGAGRLDRIRRQRLHGVQAGILRLLRLGWLGVLTAEWLHLGRDETLSALSADYLFTQDGVRAVQLGPAMRTGNYRHETLLKTPTSKQRRFGDLGHSIEVVVS